MKSKNDFSLKYYLYFQIRRFFKNKILIKTCLLAN